MPRPIHNDASAPRPARTEERDTLTIDVLDGARRAYVVRNHAGRTVDAFNGVGARRRAILAARGQ
jgi:hypothetical protein